eukprot:3267884-Amphidinium_carterae.2
MVCFLRPTLHTPPVRPKIESTFLKPRVSLCSLLVTACLNRASSQSRSLKLLLCPRQQRSCKRQRRSIDNASASARDNNPVIAFALSDYVFHTYGHALVGKSRQLGSGHYQHLRLQQHEQSNSFAT